MVPIPELCGSLIGDSPLDQAAWGKPVSRQHGFPHHEDFEMLRVTPFQELLDGGDPPQANWSSRRDQQKHTLIAECIIELARELGEAAVIE